jgi:hypothetical protein
MSTLSTIVQAATLVIEPASTFKYAREAQGQKFAHIIESTNVLPLFLYDELQESDIEINSNYSVDDTRRFILTAITKIDRQARDEAKMTTVDDMHSTLISVMGEIYKNVDVFKADSIRARITPFPELYAAGYAGAALDMRIPFLTGITACT